MKEIKARIAMFLYINLTFVYALFQELVDCFFQKIKKLEPIVYGCKESQKDQLWRVANPWFGRNKFLTDEALRIQNDLDTANFSRSSDYYYNELDRRMYVTWGKYLKRYISDAN